MAEECDRACDSETASAPSGTLRRGDFGPQVAEMQGYLHTLGVYGVNSQPLDDAGHYGLATGHAVQWFQARMELAATGSIDIATHKALINQAGMAMTLYELNQEALNRPELKAWLSERLRFPIHMMRENKSPSALPHSAPHEVDGKGWSALINDAPYLVFLLACTRGEPYYVDTARTYPETGGALGRINGWQWHRRGDAGVVAPLLVWVEAAADQAAAQARAREICSWPHLWQRQLVERTNPRWICISNQRYLPYPPAHYARRRVPEVAEDGQGGVEADALLTPKEVVQRDAGIANARQALADLAQWAGTYPQWLKARLKAARWIVVAITATRRGPFRIEVAPGGGLDAIQDRVVFLNKTIEADLEQGRAGVYRIAWAEAYASETEALARQRELRQWPLGWQQRLIEDHNPQWRDFRAWIGALPDIPGWSWIPEQWPPVGSDPDHCEAGPEGDRAPT